MKKTRILSLVCLTLICCLFCLGAAAEVVDSGTCGEKLTWVLDDKGVLSISGTGKMSDYSVAEGATWVTYRASIQSVVIERGVTSIGKFAFYEHLNLTSVTIPESVTSIEFGAFAKCKHLTSIMIPGSVTNIGKSAFQACISLKSVNIPNSVTSIEEYTFYDCNSLTDITIGTGVTSIGSYAFAASGLTSMTIPNGVTSIGKNAFQACISLKSVNIPNSVTSIGTFAFVRSGLTSVTIPNSVTSIEERAFWDCSALERVTIPSSVSKILFLAFADCPKLQDIYYCGTQAEWDTLEKENFWDDETPGDKTIHVFTFSGTGSETKPYTIQYDKDWETLAVFIAHGSFDTTGTHFKLNESLSISTMVGTKTNPFKGTFDGNGKTLNFSFINSDKETPTAPFAYIRGATIKNLYAAGKISGNTERASGLIGENAGISSVENCHVSTELSGTRLIGGFCIGTGGAEEGISFEGCLFDGKITGTEQCGGFVAWLGKNSDLRLTNCLCKPQSSSSITEGGTFYFQHSTLATGATVTLTNCYYLTALRDAQGKQAYTVKTDASVSVNWGIAKVYDISGIDANQTGLYYNSNQYAGKDDELILNPNPKPKDSEYVRYIGDDNQPLTRGTGKTWLMPGRNVTIHAEIKPIEPYGTATFRLPKGTKTIGKNAFEGIKAEVVYVPDEVQSISTYTFANNTNLKKIRLPKDCIIDDAAFYGCSNLMAIYTSGNGTAKDWAKNNGFGYKAE